MVCVDWTCLITTSLNMHLLIHYSSNYVHTKTYPVFYFLRYLYHKIPIIRQNNSSSRLCPQVVGRLPGSVVTEQISNMSVWSAFL